MKAIGWAGLIQRAVQSELLSSFLLFCIPFLVSFLPAFLLCIGICFRIFLPSYWGWGSVKVKVEPWPYSLVTVTWPPCASTMCLTIERPRPVPPDWRERALSTR